MKNTFETGDEKLARELSHFASKIEDYALVFGISEEEVSGVKADAAYFSWVISNFRKIDLYKQHWTHFKTILRKSQLNETVLQVPELPGFEEAPTAVKPDILPRFMALVRRIKAHESYTPSIGRSLCIGNQINAPEKLQPLIKVVMRDSKVTLVWKKKFCGIFVEKDSGEGFTVHDSIFSPYYIDNSPIPQGQPATWKYRAIYISGDEKIGSWSPIVSVNVAG